MLSDFLLLIYIYIYFCICFFLGRSESVVFIASFNYKTRTTQFDSLIKAQINDKNAFNPFVLFTYSQPGLNQE